jgi:hypothetical protein
MLVDRPHLDRPVRLTGALFVDYVAEVC